jgi:hypothetical protein
MAIKNTPFYIVHGRHARLPLLSANQQNTLHQPLDGNIMEHYCDLQAEKLDAAMDIIHKENKNRTTSDQQQYNIGDIVLLYNMTKTRKQQNLHRKLLMDWIGPYETTHKHSANIYDIKDKYSNKAYTMVHSSRLKIFHS